MKENQPIKAIDQEFSEAFTPDLSPYRGFFKKWNIAGDVVFAVTVEEVHVDEQAINSTIKLLDDHLHTLRSVPKSKKAFGLDRRTTNVLGETSDWEFITDTAYSLKTSLGEALFNHLYDESNETCSMEYLYDVKDSSIIGYGNHQYRFTEIEVDSDTEILEGKWFE